MTDLKKDLIRDLTEFTDELYELEEKYNDPNEIVKDNLSYGDIQLLLYKKIEYMTKMAKILENLKQYDKAVLQAQNDHGEFNLINDPNKTIIV